MVKKVLLTKANYSNELKGLSYSTKNFILYNWKSFCNSSATKQLLLTQAFTFKSCIYFSLELKFVW